MNEVQWWHLEMFSTPVLLILSKSSIRVLHDAFSLGFFFCSLAFCFDTDTSICGKIAMYLQNKHAATHSQYPADIDQVFRVSKEGENERNNAFSIKDKLLLSVKLVKFTIKTSMIHILTAFISLE